MLQHLAAQLPKNLGFDNQGLNFFLIEEEEVARQLTLLTFECYKQVKASEFFNQHWAKDKTKHLAPNLINMITMFNEVSTWVASCIVLERLVRNRAKLLARFITIAQVCT